MFYPVVSRLLLFKAKATETAADHFLNTLLA